MNRRYWVAAFAPALLPGCASLGTAGIKEPLAHFYDAKLRRLGPRDERSQRGNSMTIDSHAFLSSVIVRDLSRTFAKQSFAKQYGENRPSRTWSPQAKVRCPEVAALPRRCRRPSRRTTQARQRGLRTSG